MTRDKGVFKRKRRDEDPPEHAGVDINDLGWLEDIRTAAEQEGDVAPRAKKVGRVRSHRDKTAPPPGDTPAAPPATGGVRIGPAVPGPAGGLRPVSGAAVGGVRPVSGGARPVSGGAVGGVRPVSGGAGGMRPVSGGPMGGVRPVSAAPAAANRPVSVAPGGGSAATVVDKPSPLDPDELNRTSGPMFVTAPPRGSGAKFKGEGLPKSHGRRAAIKGQMRDVGRLRLLAFGVVVLALLGLLPVAVAVHEAGQDPVLDALHQLDVPAWAAEQPSDHVTGSRWCIRECRFYEREVSSRRPMEEVATAYQKALRDAGWTPWKSATCPPPGTEGLDSCWQRDQYVLDLLARVYLCDTPVAGETDAAANTPYDECRATQVTIKVYQRHAYPIRLG